ncbi:MAG: polysaccharide biosynthesis protein [Crocinitomicaceae bacterium]|nr:polysaccharide biosynthesis protein [Crocinitomicaceae bacterium]
MRIPQHITPRWAVFGIDVIIAVASLVVAYLVRFDTSNLPFNSEYQTFITGLPVFICVRAACYFLFKIHTSILRHTSSQDVKGVIFSVGFGTLILALISSFKFIWVDGLFLFPLSILVVEFFVTICFLLVFRFAIKLLYLEGIKSAKQTLPTAIYGAGIYGLITKHTLDKEANLEGNVVCFIDDDKKKAGSSLEGLPIYHTSQLDHVLKSKNIRKMILAIKNPDNKNKRLLIDTCLANNVETLNVPSPTNWINGEFTTGQIKPIRIEDLLGRESIQLDQDKLMEEFNNKVILVTGAAGSIGSEIVRQLVEYAPKLVVLLDQAESPIYELERELIEKKVQHITESVIADIRNPERLENVFKTFKPQYVFHAAAYKHVPLMEDNPSEALLTNVQGSKNVVDLAVKYKVEKFVMISTDKAVNPTNVMGCSKRIAEIYAQSANSIGKTKFITTRFGNVLGSNGSVIPLFKKQIEAGGPVTVTDKNITRYFMTIPEACQLVLEAGMIGKGKEIFVFDMGESVRIYDLAIKMIKLSGLEPGKDIQIKITGLRPGEKLYEELLTKEENTIPTHHPQILVAKVREYDFEEISRTISQLTALFGNQNNNEIVQLMKEIVPEFKSNNSVFENLDK